MIDAAVDLPTDPGAHEWYRRIWVWHVGFGALAALTGGVLLVDDPLRDGLRYPALLLLAALTGWYAATGARALNREPSRLGWVYLLGAAPLTIGLFGLTPAAAGLLFALYPQFWALLPARHAIAATASTVVATAVLTYRHSGWAPERLPDVVVWSGMLLLVGTGLGWWISKIIAQSSRRAELVHQLAAARARLAEVSREAGVLAERQRLAHEIHDTLAQGFAGTLLLVDAADTALDRDPDMARRHLSRARQTARDSLAEARAVVAALAPPQLRDASLADTIRALAGRLLPAAGVDHAVTVTGAVHPLPLRQEVLLLRVAQEAVANVHKHAAATRVAITLRFRADGTALQVTDDGRGFDPTALAPAPGFGLPGLRARVAAAGGRLTVASAPGAGTTVRVELAA